MHRTARQAKPCGRADGTGGQEPHGAEVIEAIQDAPNGIVIQGVWREGVTQEEFGVLMGEKRFSAIEWAPATERIEHEAQHDRARVHVYLRGHGVMDEANEASLVGVGFEHGQMVDGVHLDLGWEARQSALPRRTLAVCCHFGHCNPPLGMASGRP